MEFRVNNVLSISSVLMIFCIQFSIYSQGIKDNLSVASPNATSLGTNVETPVSLSSGSASIGIPLYEIKGNCPPVPISMNYNATGVKPDVHPGWVGMNWSLNAGGMITRITKGIPDEMAWKEDITFYASQTSNHTREFFKGYSYWTNKLDISNWNQESNVKGLAKNANWVDTDPDEFIFNFCGYSGKFYLDEKGAFKVLGNPNVKVEVEDTLMSVRMYTYLMSPAIENIDGTFTTQERQIKGFRITTPEGIQYEFGLWNRAQKLENLSYEASYDFFQKGFLGESWDTWYLIRVVNPNNGETVSFQYEPGNPVASFGRSIAMNKQGGSATPRGIFKIFGPVSSYSSSIMERWTGKLIFPLYLKKIVSSNIEVIFHKSPSVELVYNYNSIASDLAYQSQQVYQRGYYTYSPRVNIAARAEDVAQGIPRVFAFLRNDYKVFDNFGNVLVNANVINYFNNVLLESTNNGITGLFSDGMNIYEAVDFRKLVWYKLDKIEVKARNNSSIIKSYEFSYNNNLQERLMLMSIKESGNGISNPPYSFEYEDYNSNYYPGVSKLPPYNSYKVDHWGFYNGIDSRQGLNFSDEQSLINFKSKKEPVRDSLYAGILNKITYPTGGYTRFIYEPHSYNKTITRDKQTGNFSLRSETSNKTAGGLRIKEIQQVFGQGQPDVVKKYEYEGGILTGDSQYYWKNYTGRFLETDNTYTADRFVTNTILPVSSNSTGIHIAYSKVKEIFPENGYNEYLFSNFDTNPDENFNYSIDAEKSIYSPFINREIERGRLINLKKYSQGAKLLYEEDNKYEAKHSNFIRAVSTTQIPVFEGWTVEGTAYRILNYDYLMKTQKINVFNQ